MIARDKSICATQCFIELIERVGFREILLLTAEACDVELDSEDPASVRRIESLTTLAEHLRDVAHQEVKV